MTIDRKRTGVNDLKEEGYTNSGVDLSSLLERHHFGEIGSGADFAFQNSFFSDDT